MCDLTPRETVVVRAPNFQSHTRSKQDRLKFSSSCLCGCQCQREYRIAGLKYPRSSMAKAFRVFVNLSPHTDSLRMSAGVIAGTSLQAHQLVDLMDRSIESNCEFVGIQELNRLHKYEPLGLMKNQSAGLLPNNSPLRSEGRVTRLTALLHEKKERGQRGGRTKDCSHMYK